jgi:D-methionine transport system substrate-binding protein
MKNIKKIASIVLVLILVLSFAACGKSKKTVKIAVPQDPTNEARALVLLQVQGVLKLKDTGDSLATKSDIAENPHNVEIVEAEAAQVPSILKDVDYAVINSNYAIEAGLTPFVTEGTDVSYPNVVCVKEGNESSDKTKALIAAINSQQVKDFINNTYKGAIVCDLGEVGDGYDATVDYEALKGTTIVIGASPVPHADILAVAKEVLAAKGITLEIKEFADYVLPNTALEDGELDANYFAHIPYQQNFNEENGTHIVWVLEVHHEPMGVYSSTFSDWSGLE